MRELYPDRFPDRPVRWEAAYRWLADVGVDVVYLAPDGETDVPKAERTGCWSTDFPKVLEYKEAYYAQIALNDWTRNVEGAVEAGVSWEDAVEMMGPRPPEPSQSRNRVFGFGRMGPRPPEPSVFVDTAWKATGTKPKAAVPGDTQERKSMTEKDKEPQEKQVEIDFENAILWLVGAGVHTVSPPLHVTDTYGLKDQAVTLRLRPDGTSRLLIAEGGSDKVRSMDGALCLLHGQATKLRWRQKRNRIAGRFTAEQTAAILGT